jgi:GNAT superfamily N-acetyltransferase
MVGSDAIVIREASPEAVGVLVGFDPVAQAGDVTRRTAIEASVSAGFTLIAESGADIVGYVSTLPGHFLDRDFVALLIVHPSYRRRGVGRTLLDAAVKCATGNRVFTSTNKSNAPMKALLASRGWLYSGTLDGLDPGDPEEFYYIDR